ncbi:MAG: hypothetical protein M1357_00400 [Candidatus Marsarchaeota archaeon]|nr:hypothetical protein [Candidatus Marsarchaeota archaeon]
MNYIIHPLSKKESKSLITLIEGSGLAEPGSTLWATRLDKHTTLYLVDKTRPIWVEASSHRFPYISVADRFARMASEVWVDQGAAAKVSVGADLMSPGVVKVGEFRGEFVLVRDPGNAVVAVGRWCDGFREMLSQRHGKVVLNLHHPEDRIVQAVKQMLG